MLPFSLHQRRLVQASYTFSVRAIRYSNPSHRSDDRGYCDTIFHRECENKFKFCLRPFGTSLGSNENNCPLGSYPRNRHTEVIGGDVFDFGASQIANGVPNPMVFTGNEWPVSCSESHCNNDTFMSNLCGRKS